MVARAVLPAKDVDKVLQSSRDGAAILLVARRRLHEAHAENRRLDKALLRKRRPPPPGRGRGKSNLAVRDCGALMGRNPYLAGEGGKRGKRAEKSQ
ncbi:MAG: hypothetical protein ACO2PM_12715 [Pyrobaculum sp.]